MPDQRIPQTGDLVLYHCVQPKRWIPAVVDEVFQCKQTGSYRVSLVAFIAGFSGQTIVKQSCEMGDAEGRWKFKPEAPEADEDSKEKKPKK